MADNTFEQINLEHGQMRVYDFGTVKLHAYQTNDPIDDEVFVIEKDGCGFVIEYPPFFNNIEELTTYLTSKNITVEGIVAAYHMAGASFLPGVPVYATAEADAYGHTGGGKALINKFTAAFGTAFDSSIPTVTNIIEGDELTLAGVTMRILRNDEAFDIELPEINAVYIHMLGHDCHSIVAGAGHADGIIAQLNGFLDQGITMVLTSHYTPEGQKDVRTKIAYLEDLKAIAAGSANGAEFKAAVEAKYPEYSGANYLDMTCGFFFSE